MENSKQVNVRKGITIGVIVCALVLVGFLGSYAFFIGQVGQNQNQSVSVQTGNMALTFNDGNNGFSEALEFGGSAEKTFTIENSGTGDGVVSISWMNLENTYLEGSLTYSFSESDSEDGTFTPIVENRNIPRNLTRSDRVLVSGLTIPAQTTKYYKLVITLNYTDFDQTADLEARLDTQFKITEGILKEEANAATTLARLGKTVKDESPDFATIATTDETQDGLYAMEDDYGTSYYYRGAVEDNYVKFAEFYWRIIRVNGDGSLRLIYDGTSAHANTDTSTDRLALTSQAYNASHNDAKYVGYMYSPSGTTASSSKEQAQSNKVNSDIKTAIESWYKTNIADRGYDEYVSDNIFCNDRSTPGSEATGWSADTGLGYGTNVTGYGGYARLSKDQNNPSPKIECENKNDAFTKEDTEKGNGKLGEKVGMITADEIVLAGSGKYNTENQSYYLHKGNWYWSLSPYNMYTSGNAYVFYVNSNGYLNSNDVSHAGGVAPVINLGAEYVNTMVGDGSASSPFEVK